MPDNKESRAEISWDGLFLRELHMTGGCFFPFTFQAARKGGANMCPLEKLLECFPINAQNTDV